MKSNCKVEILEKLYFKVEKIFSSFICATAVSEIIIFRLLHSGLPSQFHMLSLNNIQE